MYRSNHYKQPVRLRPVYKGYMQQCPNCKELHLYTERHAVEPYCSSDCKVADFSKPKEQKIFTCHHKGCLETEKLTSIKAFGEWIRHCPKHQEQYRMFPSESAAPAFLMDHDE
ncbi:MAG: hypothetical protein JWP00_1493 [Chloroflexi bacterium]|nr:hypothetical protein [Chloroflexota bacterium]